ACEDPRETRVGGGARRLAAAGILLAVGVTERLARACARRPRRVIGVWIAAVVAAFVLGFALFPGNLTTNGYVTNNPDSRRAEALFNRFPSDPNAVDEIVDVRNDRLTVDRPAYRRFVEEMLAQARATGVIYRARTWYATHDPSLVSADRHATLVTIQRQHDVDRLLPVVERHDGQYGFEVVMTGGGTLDHDFNDLSQHDLKHGELAIGLPAALVILVLVFGAVVAGLIPLLMAIVAIVVALGLVSILAEAFTLSVFVINMLTGMGLALGIDYSLFILSRYREERARGLEKPDAIAAAGATSSRAVLFSGSVFVIALTGMLLVPSNVMRSLADGAIAVGVVSVLAALTLLPALLGLLGDRVNALRVPFVGRDIAREGAAEGRFWGAIVARVLRAPVLSILVFVALLLAAASPALGLKLGASGVATLPDRLESKRGFEALARDFPRASSSPVLIAVEADVRSEPVRRAIARLRAEVARDPAFGGRTDLRVTPDGELAAVGALITGD